MNSLPSAERQKPALLERITQLWPEALSRDSAPEEKALLNSDPNHETRQFTDEMTVQANDAERKEVIARVDLEDGVYIGCAGLVLLHPFLPRLFEALGIAAEDKLEQPERALRLLHFLATGQRIASEYELLLPKLLCNVPFEVVVESQIELTTAEEEEAVALLEAVIHHWDALGDTSVDGLRGTFLARPGKLSRRDNGDDLLPVETRSFDILLDRLPWGIGMIQLPWMKKILWVEWAY
ncbi:MAG: contractile injection system tape measure protein [Pseudomonadota bacterium]|nr:contractile injection system tape measure protein [Pseudomonadota bacterium]